MSFTQIEIDTPVVKPSTEEKVYNKLWMKFMRVISNSPQEEAKLIAHMIPYDGLGNVLDTNNPQMIVVDNLFMVASKRQDFAMAMEAVFQSINSWIADKKWFNEVIAPLIEKQRTEELTQEELDLIEQAKNKALL